ncbi:hypothetical protein CI102_2748 [Trichoderma harzianum]|uniref:Mid2 domain-containing protein n=1 Tax=Trichoderma harzianum CBS 226.95 TaxID=983964 RepID=A0A2T4AJ03_TRIHA|nr:hypothetical protein M431DRAFT_80646 [Trichoderma harzianum CBS 226.95]PKK51232.1 hypothetical protein CI102_2748 [Trichoderma harzianum]PTB57027.1 hypothetical protein M431DRAFT_80646 [Trichoderma harzianum CBS 226.95]
MARCSLLFTAIWLATLSSASTSSTPSKTPTKTPKPSASSKCFYPNGKPEQNFSYNYQPCGGKNTTWSQCCIPGQDVCTPDGLCTHLTNAVGAYDYRGGCTNADWSGCPQICLDVLSNSWLQVKQCASGQYCCNPDFDNGDCCRDGSRRFSLLDRNPDAKGDDTPGKTNGTNTSSTANTSATTQTDDSAAKQTSDEAAQKTDDGADKSNKSVTIGAAVGGSLGGIALIGGIVGVWLLLRKKKQQKMARVEKDGREVNSGTVESMGMKQTYTPLAEVEGQPAVVEVDSRGVHELG